jgi:adenine phosphoribosyltransferase
MRLGERVGRRQGYGLVPMNDDTLRKIIRTVPDWPKPGVNFFDICSIVEHPAAFAWTVNRFSVACGESDVEALVSPDARGFLWGSAVSFAMRLPLHLARKPGKLPGEIVTESYAYEYSETAISMQTGCELQGKRVMVLDDVLATGGTALAIVRLLCSHFGVRAENILVGAVISLEFLGGSRALKEAGVRVQALLEYHE